MKLKLRLTSIHERQQLTDIPIAMVTLTTVFTPLSLPNNWGKFTIALGDLLNGDGAVNLGDEFECTIERVATESSK